MTALTKDNLAEHKEGKLLAFPVKGSTKIYQGAICKVTAAGYLAGAAAEAGAVFAGMAYEQVDNSSGADGAVKCRVLTEGVFPMAGSGFAQSDLGSKVYASDDQTVSTTQGANEQEVGKIVEVVSATEVMVMLKQY